MGHIVSGLASVGARQMKAARALLDWSQEDLATATDLSIATIRKLEMGHISPRASTTSVLRQALEEAGVEFLDHEGVRRRADDVRTYQGRGGYENFLSDMLGTVQKTGCDILMVGTSDQAFGFLSHHEAQTKLDQILEGTGSSFVKILVIDGGVLVPSGRPRLLYRTLSTNYVAPMPFCVFGDKYAFSVGSENNAPRIVVIQSKMVAMTSQKHFYSMWDKATGFLRDEQQEERKSPRLMAMAG